MSANLIHARWIATVAPGQDAVLEDHSLLMDGRDIADILPSDEARRKYPDASAVRLPRHLLVPGFVNAHGHAAMSLLRNVADNAPLSVWLQEHIWPLEARWVSEDFVRDGTRFAILEMLRGGTSCFSDMYFFPQAAAEAVAETGIRAQIIATVSAIRTNWARDEEESLKLSTAFIESCRGRGDGRLRSGFGPHSPYAVSDKGFAGILERNADLDVPIHIHLHETEGETREGVERWGCRPIEYLHRLGLDFRKMQCVHMVAIDDSDLELLRQTQVRIAHCPRSNMRLGSGFFPLTKLSAITPHIGLGTDGGASNTLSMLEEMRAAVLMARGLAAKTEACSAHRALRMATLGGAEVLGWEREIGSLEVGKRADIAAVDLYRPHTWPVRDPVAQMVFGAEDSQVSHLWVDGALLMEGGEPQSVDTMETMELAADWQRRMEDTAQAS